MADFFRDNPGFVYVIATLLPLLSFFVILLCLGLRCYLRRFYDPEENRFVNTIYAILDGEGRTKIGAVIATTAIALSFCLVLYGFVRFQTDYHAVHAQEEQPEQRAQIDPNEERDRHELEEEFHRRWNASLTWASLTKVGSQFNDPQQATTLQIGYRIDHLSAIMFLMVTFIATFIHLFSVGYMSEELHSPVEDHQVHTEGGHLKRRGRYSRFFMYLSLFCFSMLNLILANNLFQVFISWELVGICSFLLIGFYYERTSASNAANKAFITNRIGDAGFIVGMLIIWTYIGSFNFEDIFQRLRAPERDHANELLVSAGKIVRANPVAIQGATAEEAKKKKLLRLLDREQPTSFTTYAILFPRDQSEFHALQTPAEVKRRVKEILDNKDDKEREEKADIERYKLQKMAYANPLPQDCGFIPYWMLVVAGLGIFLGCVGKSAQFPLHVWLPDAMEGPTPVSALIHAATMVAAGVYLVGRVYPLFTPEVLLVIAYVGGITLFVAATIAVVMTDIKKVLAYSTVSQLGYMMLALGIGGWVAGLFHLITHAFFKGLLFLCSGSVIYGCHHEQEMPKMGGLFSKMKITALTMLVGVFAICGVPLFSGWYSKDAIIAQGFGYGFVNPEHFLLTLLPLVTAGITAFYMFRMWFLTFAGEPRDHHVHEHAQESPWVMTAPLIVLSVFSIVVAWGWPMWQPENSWLESQLHHSQYTYVQADFGTHPMLHEHPMDYQPIPAKQNVRFQALEMHDLAGMIALFAVVIGFAFAASMYWYRILDPAEAKTQFLGIYNFLAHKWRFDELYSALLVRPTLVISSWCRNFDLNAIDGAIHLTSRITIWTSWLGGAIDRYVVDGLVNLISTVCYGVGSRLRKIQTGYLRSYVLFLVLAAIGLWVVLAMVTRALSGGQ